MRHIHSSHLSQNAVRVTDAKRDTLQEAITLIKKEVTDFPLQYGNFRD